MLVIYSMCGVWMCLVSDHLTGSTGQRLEVESALKSENCSRQMHKYSALQSHE